MKKNLLSIFLISFGLLAFAQNEKHEFWDDIQNFKKRDSINTPVLFLGSSSFTIWQDAGDYFPGTKITNRAFGASRIEHQIFYIQEVTLDYKPNKIVFYCGENDISAGASPAIVLDRFITWFRLTRKNLPNVEIIYVSMKPSPLRESMLPDMIDGNNRIRHFLSGQANTHYVDIVPLMLNENGKIKEELFLDDRLHMNKAGYLVWQKALAPYIYN